MYSIITDMVCQNVGTMNEKKVSFLIDVCNTFCIEKGLTLFLSYCKCPKWEKVNGNLLYTYQNLSNHLCACLNSLPHTGIDRETSWTIDSIFIWQKTQYSKWPTQNSCQNIKDSFCYKNFLKLEILLFQDMV